MMENNSLLRKFFFPRLTRSYLLRIAVVALLSYIVFSFVLVPVRLRGKSMEPTFRDGSLHFIFAQSYLFSGAGKGDVVGIKLAGRKVVLLKRIVAVEGEKIAFRKGVLMINGEPRNESYVKGDCDWDYSEKEIRKGNVFVVGDNRSVPAERHDFGEVSRKRILGRLIW
jgi:signal peptidase I